MNAAINAVPNDKVGVRVPVMQAMLLESARTSLKERDVAMPLPGPQEILIKISACAVCRTDLHIIDGELPVPKLPLIMGHEIVGHVVEKGPAVDRFAAGQMVGVPWLAWTCGQCRFCQTDRENLCDQALFTGYTRNGGFAEYVVADARYCLAIPPGYSAVAAAPLLCAGLIGYRCLTKTGSARRIGLYGFGAAAHLVTQIARHQQRSIYAFTRPDDLLAQRFAIEMGAVWAGDSTQPPPLDLDAAIIFAPNGALVPEALRRTARGGCVVCGGIHMSDIPSFSYDLLWGERTICSVANLTRTDGAAFMEQAMQLPIHSEIQVFPLSAANEALTALRAGNLRGAAVLVPDP